MEMNTIIQGDCLEVLKSIEANSIDLGVTSPPYNKQEKQKGWLVKNVKYNNYKDVKTEEEYQQEQIDVLNEIYRITKAGGSFFYNHKTRWDKGEMYHPIHWLASTNWLIKQEIIWDRMIAANIRGWRFWQVDERIYWLYKPIAHNKIGTELASKDALLTSIWRFAPERDNPHPAPFPITLPTRIITSILGENAGIVLDPYCGSGTTLVAAKLMNKNYIGIDISEDYINFAKKRLANCESEMQLVKEELSKHIVHKTFKERKNNGEWTGKHKASNNAPENISEQSSLQIFE
jgi:modification methylase